MLMKRQLLFRSTQTGLLVLFFVNNLFAQQSTGILENFKISNAQNIKEDIGIANGKITVGIDPNDIVNINGIWAPPCVSSDFFLKRICKLHNL
jgi:hypothetical protein